jgi:predicted Zn-dependent peptidase
MPMCLPSATDLWVVDGDLGAAVVFDMTSYRRKLPRLASVADGIVETVHTEPFTADAVERGRTVLLDQIAGDLVGKLDRVTSLADCMKQTGTPSCATDYRARLLALTDEDLQRVAQTWLVPEQRIRLSIVPTNGRSRWCSHD